MLTGENQSGAGGICFLSLPILSKEICITGFSSRQIGGGHGKVYRQYTGISQEHVLCCSQILLGVTGNVALEAAFGQGVWCWGGGGGGGGYDQSLAEFASPRHSQQTFHTPTQLPVLLSQLMSISVPFRS